ncbi:MAG: hypothetical protein GC168_10025 [Candidatus Hydrogenedens sp.]|nr:hypothetical protein [Candidatus Hydrogenedens sp.]
MEDHRNARFLDYPYEVRIRLSFPLFMCSATEPIQLIALIKEANYEYEDWTFHGGRSSYPMRTQTKKKKSPIFIEKGISLREWVYKEFGKPPDTESKDFDDIWIYQRYLVLMRDSGAIDCDKAKLLVREAVWKHEKRFNKLQQLADVEASLRKADRRAVIPEEIKMFVWRRDEGKCVECGSKTALEFDHIIPVSKGGGNTARNLQILCESCNRKKSNRI